MSNDFSTKYPECDKINKNEVEHNTLHHFFDWLDMMEMNIEDNGKYVTREKAIHGYFGIDSKKHEKELRAMLEELRENL